MRSQRKGGLPAITKVKVFSPVIVNIALGHGFHILEASTAACVRGEHAGGVPGSKSMAGRSSRQGCNPAGESPAVSVARIGHVVIPHPGMGNHPGYAWCKRPGRPVDTAVGATWRPNERGSLKVNE